ncbi:YbaK/prolyl-tRNA synthetase associated domain-containing protein [Streptomyces sp. RPA4-5]|uniref:YbaK/EbsC family protein n=1 Tax=Streptomyces TaxID=1883 RepID=UPI00143EF206|nr:MULTISPECIES: YbaK/EbsC family protein [Streptomyces]MCX4637631.1 YbaK/prolyl-tRNA synthetase associated domain-containing protein [Streptomyces platensis]QIY53687.1 YbaK/prolyl-tRNA synthetase associated domain-containing protein [Streptomyces sp. RPA4-5]
MTAHTVSPDAPAQPVPTEPADSTPGTTSARLLALLQDGQARHRLIEHAPEGRTDVVSALRGNALDQAAKCIVVRVKVTKKSSRYALAVVPGDRRVDLARLKELYDARHVSFADQATAERLSSCVSGSIVPFSFDPELELIVDPGLLEHQEIFFNAAELDLSLALHTEDYQRLAAPRVTPIAEPLAGAAT